MSMTETTQTEAQLHDLLLEMQQKQHNNIFSDTTISNSNKKISTKSRAPTNLWEELQEKLKFYREKNP